MYFIKREIININFISSTVPMIIIMIYLTLVTFAMLIFMKTTYKRLEAEKNDIDFAKRKENNNDVQPSDTIDTNNFSTKL